MAAGAVALVLAVGPCRPASHPTVGAGEVDRLVRPVPDVGATMTVVPGTPPRAEVKVPPVLLRIPALGVEAEVDPVGVDWDSGELAVPPSVDRVGWYLHGPGLEADAGSVVIAGHVDGATQGEGAFFRLHELHPGDTVTATGGDGAERHWRVVARERYEKAKIPLDRYFARDGRPRLTLITCGGPFDPDNRRYRDNIVITATPVGR